MNAGSRAATYFQLRGRLKGAFKNLYPTKIATMRNVSCSFMRFFESRIETDGVFGTRMVVARLAAIWRHVSDFRHFSEKIKLFKPIYLEIACDYPSI